MSIQDDIVKRAALDLIAERFKEIYGISLYDCNLLDAIDSARVNHNWGGWFRKTEAEHVVPLRALSVFVRLGLMRLNRAETKYQITKKGRDLLEDYYNSSLSYCHRQLEEILNTLPPLGELK
jgi:hypothetical protein